MLTCPVFTSFQPESPILAKVGYPLCFDNDPFCLSPNPFLLITIWIAYVRALPARILASLFATLCQEQKTSPIFSIICALFAQNAGVCIPALRQDTRAYPNCPLPQALFPQARFGTGDGPAPVNRHSSRTLFLLVPRYFIRPRLFCTSCPIVPPPLPI